MELEFANFFIFPPKRIKVLVQTFLCPSLLTQTCFSNLSFVNTLEVVHGPPWIPS